MNSAVFMSGRCRQSHQMCVHHQPRSFPPSPCSQYKHMRRTMPARPECEQLASWPKFCAFPPSMGLACRHHPQCCVMKEVG